MRMGLPKLLTTDQGKEFRNNLDKEMTELLGINSFTGIGAILRRNDLLPVGGGAILRQQL